MITGIAVRYSDDLGQETIDTVSEHNLVIAEKGSVFLGKFGQPVGPKHIEACNNGAEYKLILVKKNKPGKYTAYSAKISSIQKIKPKPGLSPTYYLGRSDIKIWFELREPLTLVGPEELAHWITKSSGQSLLTSLHFSMSGIFYVKYDPNAKPGLPRSRVKRATKKSINGSSKKSANNQFDTFDFEALDDFLGND